MTSSFSHDVITPVLMTSYDSIQVNMIQHTHFYDPAKVYLKWDIFELLGPIPGGAFQKQFTGSHYEVMGSWYRMTQCHLLPTQGIEASLSF